jgi:Flp pilus assembly protein TadG
LPGRLSVPIRRRGRSKGQSVVEFALVFPVVLLLLLVAIDMGRVYLGWVALNNASRIAANYAAENPTASFGPGSAYATAVQADIDAAAGLDCAIASIPPPTFSGNGSTATSLANLATVRIDCVFHPITPIIGSIVGNGVRVTAISVFPIRVGFSNK